MKYIFVLIAYLFVLPGTNGHTQTTGGGQIFLEDITGRPLKLKAVEEVEGSPYLSDEWKKGTVTFENGQVLSGVDLKFALYGNQLFFQKDGQMLEFMQPVKEFTLGNEGRFRNGYPASGDNTTKTFYEVRTDGNNQLLVFRSKEVKEHKSYNEPIKQRFADKEILYAYLADKTMHLISGDKKSVLAVFPDRADAINKFINEKKLKFKNTADLAAVFEFVNTLQN